jgi:DNA ligase-1
MKAFKPMLAAQQPKEMPFDEYIESLAYPVIASPKLDGIRCLTMNQPGGPGLRCAPSSRSLKSIPNNHIYQTVGQLPPYLDGEIVIKGGNFQSVQSQVMAHGGMPDFEYHVFDYFEDERRTFSQRLQILEEVCYKRPEWLVCIPQLKVFSPENLLEWCDQWAKEGYEGACVRHPEGPYKFGRSTYKQGWLLKIVDKRRIECRIIGFTEKMHNANEAETNALGYMERSTKKENMVGMNTLGALVVEDIAGEFEPFQVGTGFDDAMRKQIWLHQSWYKDRLVTVEYKPYGTKNKPRTPVFVGERHVDDM